MPATSSDSPTGDSYVDGVLIGAKWAVNSLTFSFPTAAAFYGPNYPNGEPANHFAAVNAVQQASIFTVLASYASVANLTFAEVTETETHHGDLRYAESDSPSTAWAYYPNTAAYGGDIWFNDTRHFYDNPAKGNYGWSTVLHETGHALGLKHPHETGYFGAMPADRDSLEYSVMSYRSYIGASTSSGYTNGASSFPQTLMMYDIAGIQRLYGANYAFNSGDTAYRFDATTGQMFVNDVGQGAPVANKIFLTIWDGGGEDTYSFANYVTDLSVSLLPGGWSTLSVAQLANLGDFRLAAGNIANALLFGGNQASLIENVIGGAGNDLLVGNAADNEFIGGHGNDFLDGGAGINTAGFSGSSADYASVQNADGSWTVSDLRAGSPDGADTLDNIQWLEFSDGLAALGPVAIPDLTESVNFAPEAQRDVFVAIKNTKLKIAAGGVLANDSDSDGDVLTAVRVTKLARGGLSLHDDGSFTFMPAKDFTGLFRFTYVADDGEAGSDVTTVRIRVINDLSGRANANGLEDHDITKDQVPQRQGVAGFDVAGRDEADGRHAWIFEDRGHHAHFDSGLLYA